jgi:hypothetical protein
MPAALALVVAPLLALACQGAMFALVSPACSVQTRLALHAVAALGLVATVVLALLARRQWRQPPPSAERAEEGENNMDARTTGPAATRRVLAGAGMAVAALSALVIATMWFAAWALPACWP